MNMLPVRRTWPRSIANTPIWQVTLEASSTRVLVVASGMLRCTGGHGLPRPLSTERIVKYMANSAAKNISSEDSQTIVPTLTRLGLLAGVRGVTSVVAVATRLLLRHGVGGARPTPESVASSSMKVVVYSHDADTRARVKLAIGRRPAPDVPEAEVIEVATHPALIRLL